MNRVKTSTALVLAICAVMAVLPAAAEERRILVAGLNGVEVVPAVITTAAGSFRGTADFATSEIEYRLFVQDLEGSITGAAIHLGQRGVNGAVVVALCGTPDLGPSGFVPCPASGELTGTISAADVLDTRGQGIAAGEIEKLFQAMRAGAAYVSVTSDRFVVGEVRGQIGVRLMRSIQATRRYWR